MPAIDLVFDPTSHDEENVGGMHHTRQMDTAPAAWDHLDQQSPETITQANHPGRSAYVVPPSQAIPVLQRSVNHCTFTALPIMGTVTSNPGPTELVTNQKGRAFVIIKCPSTNTKGVYISDEKDSLSSVVNPILAWLVLPADPPLLIPSEDAIWFMGQTGAVATDVVQVCVGWYRPDEY